MSMTICLITGLIASGKSTAVRVLAERPDKAVRLRGNVFRRMTVLGREDMAACAALRNAVLNTENEGRKMHG